MELLIQNHLYSHSKTTPMKYEKKEEMKNESSFFLYDEDDHRLFSFHDIWMGKKGYKACCNQDDDCNYDYQRNEKALTGITGLNNEDLFD